MEYKEEEENKIIPRLIPSKMNRIIILTDIFTFIAGYKDIPEDIIHFLIILLSNLNDNILFQIIINNIEEPIGEGRFKNTSKFIPR